MRYMAFLIFMIGCTPPGKPTPPKDTDTFDALYAQNCAGCHGADGRYGCGPLLNDSLYLQKQALEPGRWHVIAQGRKGTAMPAFAASHGGPLTDAQIQILTSGMDKKWVTALMPEVTIGYPGQSTGNMGVPRRTEGAVQRGRAVFAQHCAGCHGANGRGGKSGDVTIGGLNDPAYLNLTSNTYLWRVAVLGRRDLGCPDYSFIGGPSQVRLNQTEADDVVAYIAAWRTP